MKELFGPIAFVVATENTADSIAIAKKAVRAAWRADSLGLLHQPDRLDQVADAAAETGVALSCNLCGGVYVNQSAAFSDFHGTGANPAANSSLTDTAFVAGRFRVAQSRAHV